MTVNVGPLYSAGGEPVALIPVKVRLDAKIRIIGSGAVLPTFYSVATDVSGEASIELVATDSTGIDNPGFTYHFEIPGWTVEGGIDIALPAAVPVVQFEDLSGTVQSNGVVIWVPADITDAQIEAAVTDTGSDTRAALDALYSGGGGGGGVTSVNGMTGAVSLSGVYDPAGTAASQVSAHAASNAHDGRYYTEAEVNAALATKQNTPTGIPTGSKFLRDDNSWQALPPAGAATLDDLTDVDEGSPPAGAPLIHDGDGTWSGAGAAAILEGDARLTNARTPSAHTHPASDIASGTIAIARIPTGTSGTTVALGNDARLSDQRVPTAEFLQFHYIRPASPGVWQTPPTLPNPPVARRYFFDAEEDATMPRPITAFPTLQSGHRYWPAPGVNPNP